MIQGYPEPHATHLGKTPKQNTFGALVVDGTQHLWTGTTVEDTSAQPDILETRQKCFQQWF